MAVESMPWFYYPSPAWKKSVGICSTKLFPDLVTYYIFLEFMYGILSTYRQESFDVSGHIIAMQKTNLESDWVK